ncbi:MAG: hypothetical protein ACR2MB_08775 [Acidimicrobiales bacterium]
MPETVRREGKLAFLAAVVADYEVEFGEIAEADVIAQQAADRANATIVRGRVSDPRSI